MGTYGPMRTIIYTVCVSLGVETSFPNQSHESVVEDPGNLMAYEDHGITCQCQPGVETSLLHLSREFFVAYEDHSTTCQCRNAFGGDGTGPTYQEGML